MRNGDESLEEKIERVELIVENQGLREEVKNLRNRTGELDKPTLKHSSYEKWSSKKILKEIYRFSNLPSNEYDSSYQKVRSFQEKYFNLPREMKKLMVDYLDEIDKGRRKHLHYDTEKMNIALLAAGIGGIGVTIFAGLSGEFDNLGLHEKMKEGLTWALTSSTMAGVFGYNFSKITESLEIYKINRSYVKMLDMNRNKNKS